MRLLDRAFHKRYILASLLLSVVMVGCAICFLLAQWMQVSGISSVSGVLHAPLHVKLAGALIAAVVAVASFVCIQDFCGGLDEKAAAVNVFNGGEAQTLWESRMDKLFILFMASAAITVCSRSSPLYPFNNWNDTNCFFTVGKGMFNGLVPYRDLFEHKGPLLYFLYGLAGLVSRDTFIGTYILEIIAAYFYLLYSYRTALLLLQKKCSVLISLIAVITYSSWAFEQGGSAEELCLPLLAFSLWLAVRGAVGQQLSRRDFISLGVVAGCVFWVKFTLIGFYIGWFIFFACDALKRREGNELLSAVALIAAGVILATIPWLLYFGIHGAIADWLEVYLYNNLFLYSGAATNAVFAIPIFGGLLEGALNFCMYNPVTLIFFAAAFLLMLRFRRERSAQMLMLTMFFTFFFVFVAGQKLRYYSLVMSLFLAPCLALVTAFLKKGVQPTGGGMVLVTALSLVALLLTPNRYFLGTEKEDLAQYRFREIIAQDAEDVTLLNYGGLDDGFYTVCDIQPNCKAFFVPNINLPEIRELQREYVDKGLCDYIVTQSAVGAEPEDDFGLYTCVAECESDGSYERVMFRLYKLK